MWTLGAPMWPPLGSHLVPLGPVGLPIGTLWATIGRLWAPICPLVPHGSQCPPVVQSAALGSHWTLGASMVDLRGVYFAPLGSPNLLL